MEKRTRFFWEVIVPMQRALDRSREMAYSERTISDIAVLAQEAATTAYHYPEAIGLVHPKVGHSDPELQALRQKLADVVDSRKHGALHSAERTVSLECSHDFEIYADHKRLRYLGAQVQATNQRHGQIELLKVTLNYIVRIAGELSFSVGLQEAEAPDFHETLAFAVRSADMKQFSKLRFFRRDEAGVLHPHDHDFGIELREAIEPGPVWGHMLVYLA